jgi:putative ABC transport system substrate-binding protein
MEDSMHRLQVPSRRAMVVATAIASAAPALLAQAQGDKPLRKVGVLSAGKRPPGPSSYSRAFAGEMQKLGWVENENLTYERRYAEGDYSKLDALVVELVARKVELIVPLGELEAAAALRVAPNLPIVVWSAIDPVGSGYAKSLAHPGGNVTGLTLEQDLGLNARQVQYLKDVVPELKHLGVLRDPRYPGLNAYVDVMAQAARRLDAAFDVIDVTEPDGFEAAFASLAKLNVQALVVLGSPMVRSQRGQVVTLVRKYRLPAIGPYPDAVEMGMLMSYGVDLVDSFRRSAGYVDKILKGAKPGDLAFEQPSKYELVINLKAAKELGRPVPQRLLVEATRVIE